MLFRCLCLNVSVNVATRVAPVPFPSEHVSALMSAADMDRIVSAELLGNLMNPAIPLLQTTRELGGGWTICRCLNCSMDCYGSHCSQPRRLFLNTKMQERDVFTLRSHPDYSAAFGIIIRDDLISESDSGNDAFDIQQTKALSAPVEDLLEKERKGMQARIAAFVTAQQERYRLVQQRAQRDQRVLRKKIMHAKNSQIRPPSDNVRLSSSSRRGSSVAFSSSVPSRASSLSDPSKTSPYSSSLRPALAQASRSSQLGAISDQPTPKAAQLHPTVVQDVRHWTALSSTSTPLDGTPENSEVLIFAGAGVPSNVQMATAPLAPVSDSWLAADQHHAGDATSDSELFMFEDDVPSYRDVITSGEMSEIEEEFQESDDDDNDEQPMPTTSDGEEPAEQIASNMARLLGSSVPVNIPTSAGTPATCSASHRQLSKETGGRLLTPALAEDDHGGRAFRLLNPYL